ncbi:MAG: SPASM domain-containing protein [Methermicoccaceae archaeon]
MLSEGVSVQFNMTLMQENIHELDAMVELCKDVGVDALHLFPVVPVGRGEGERLSPQAYSHFLAWYRRERKRSAIPMRATCTPQLYIDDGNKSEHTEEHTERDVKRERKGCLGGVSYCFISRKGDVYPCGYLPIIAGSIRKNSLAEIWRDSEVFKKLRDPSALKGTCGDCPYSVVCGGCRARAYGYSKDWLAEDPLCPKITGVGMLEDWGEVHNEEYDSNREGL